MKKSPEHLYALDSFLAVTLITLKHLLKNDSYTRILKKDPHLGDAAPY